MARLSPKFDTLRALFARSGNLCTFPGCDQALINHKNQFIAHVCHIEAALKGGERYNGESNDEFRRSYENLILLCYPHHIETNDVGEYPVKVLRKIKEDHESRNANSEFNIGEINLRNLEKNLDEYWSNIERLNTVDHIIPELAMEIDGDRDFLEVLKTARSTLGSIRDLLGDLSEADQSLQGEFENLIRSKNIDPKIFSEIPYIENPFEDRNWELHCLSSTNIVAKMSIDLDLLEIKYLETYVELKATDKTAMSKLQSAKNRLESIAGSIGYAD